MLLPFVPANVTLVPELDHSRWPNRARYMPHIVIGNPSQRLAQIADGNLINERYLGLWFTKAPDELISGESADVTLCLRLSIALTTTARPVAGYARTSLGAGFPRRE